MRIIENQWKSMKINTHQRTAMKINEANESQWKSLLATAPFCVWRLARPGLAEEHEGKHRKTQENKGK